MPTPAPPPDAGSAGASGDPFRPPAELSAACTLDTRGRRLSDPAKRWFRAVERRVNHFLSVHVYPRIPGMTLPYDRQLHRSLAVSHAEVSLRDLHADLEGFRLVLLTDLHAGPFVSAASLEHLITRTIRLDPDLVLLGGDHLSSRIAEFDVLRPALEHLRAPHGVFAVLGNHDYYTGEADSVRRRLEESGIEVLHNRCVTIRRGAGALTLAGVDDLLMGTVDLAAALRNADDSPVILLSHHPDIVFEAAQHDVDLVLSGHTHGGQIRLPGLPPLVRQSRYGLLEGRYRVDDTELIVSRGSGAVGLPFRLHCPPEIVLLHLKKG